MDISRPCQPEKLIPLLPWPGFDPSFSGHNDRRAIISEWTWLRYVLLGKRAPSNQNGLSYWSPLSPVIQAWHSGFKILTSPRARFQMTTVAQMTVGSPLPCPGYHDYKIPSMVYRRMSTSLGLGEPQFKTCCRSHLAGTFHTPAMCLQAWRTCTCIFSRPQSQ